MRIIAESRLREFWQIYPDAKSGLEKWYKVTRHAWWNEIAQARQSFPHADAVKVKSGKSVTVFNIGGGRYRLITAIHYNTKMIYILMFMTYAEYSKGQWKEML